MTILQTRSIAGAFLFILAFAVAACDSNSPSDSDFATQEVQALYSLVSSELSLSTEQQSRFAGMLARHDHENREPGYLWIVADSLSMTLTDDQKDGLISRTGPMEASEGFRGLRGFPGGGGYYGGGGFMGVSRRHGESGADGVVNLTEEQQERIKAIHESHREQMRALIESKRNGTLSDEEFLRQVLALHDARRSEVESVMTPDQLAALETYRAEHEGEFAAFREEVAAVRDEVLGLTAAESEAFDAILDDQLAAREVLIDQFGSGDISFAELNAEIEALTTARSESLQALLTDAQYEVVQIHDALSVRIGKRGHRGHMPRRF